MCIGLTLYACWTIFVKRLEVRFTKQNYGFLQRNCIAAFLEIDAQPDSGNIIYTSRYMKIMCKFADKYVAGERSNIILYTDGNEFPATLI